MREYHITRIPKDNETSNNLIVKAKHELLGRFEQKDDKSELMTRETSSGSQVYNKPETVVIENLPGEECPGAYTG